MLIKEQVMDSETKVIRELLTQENTLMDNRMSWFLTLQGFLFAALAFGWDKGASLIAVFGIVGIMSSISVGILMRHTVLAMRRLQEKAESFCNGPIVGRSHKENIAIVHFLLPWHFLPILFSLAWILLIVLKFF